MTDPAPAPCPVCNAIVLTTPAERTNNICDHCARTTGLWFDPPDRRKPLPCGRCNHTQFVRVMLRDRTTLEGTPYNQPCLAPFGVTYDVKSAMNRGRDQVTVTAQSTVPLGLLVSYICRGCGFTELYTVGFDEIPIGPQWGTRLVDVAPQGPDGGPFR